MTGERSLGAYLGEWLERQQTQLQPGTWVSYRGIVRRYLLPHLGEVALTTLAKRDIEALYARLFVRGGAGGGPLSKRTVAFTHAVLHKALEDAVRDDLLVRNPSHRAVLLKIDHLTAGDTGEQLDTWDVEALRTFLAATAGHRYANLFVLAAFTGLRRGELCGLRWCDVDLDRKVLRVRRSLTIDRGQVRLKEPKTSCARSLHVDETACAALSGERRDQQRRAAEVGPVWRNDWDLVFTADTGQPLVPDTVSRAFRDTVEALDLPGIRFHGLRHTHATLMLQAGVPIKVVSERLGHASAQLHGHLCPLLPAMDSDAAAAFAAHVRPRP